MAAPVARHFGLGVLAVLLVHHFGLWVLMTHSRGLHLETILNTWDSALYTTIVQDGPSGPLWAFFPAYPLVVRGVWLALGQSVAPAVVGTVLSSLALFAFVWLATRAPGDDTRLRWGLFVLLYGPASFVLHTHHTEALFMLLSFAAFFFASRAQWLPAALFAAVTLFTRNQGVLVGITVLLMLSSRVTRKHLALAASVIAAAGFGFLFFEWARTGDPLIFIHSQEHWTHASSPLDSLRALWFGNPWQNTSSGSLYRHGWVFVWLFFGLWLLRENKPLGLYALLSMVPLLLQAEFVNAFRYGVVVFPLWFFVGEKVALAPRWVQAVVVVTLVALNHLTTQRYALGLWSY